MELFGKQERKTERPQTKQPEAKSILLQTYFTSLLCLVLSVSMFFGTSYAWFTSEVTNEGNEIYIGVLDVDLQMDGKSLNNSETKVFGNTIHWEPGYTALRNLTVVNEGDLAFNYTLNFTDGEPVDENDDLDALADCFEVWVYSNDKHEAYVKTANETFAEMTAKEGWTRVGSLREVLAGEAVFSGSMTTAEVNAKGTDGSKINTAHTYTVALHMNENATADVMGKSISLSVKLIAYQMGSEQDSLGGNYDQITAVTSAEDFVNALTSPEGGTVLMLDDIEIPEEFPAIEIQGKVNLDMNGKKLILHRDGTSIRVLVNGSLTISGNGIMEKTNHDDNMLYVYGELIIVDGTFCYTPYTWGEQGDCTCSVCGSSDRNLQKLGCIIVANEGSVDIYGGSFDTGIMNVDRNNAAAYMFPMINWTASDNGTPAVITIYGGQFVDVSPAVGDANGDSLFLKGQAERGTVPAEYTITSEIADDGRTIYTVTYADLT